MTRNNSSHSQDFCTRKKQQAPYGETGEKERPNLKLLRAVSAPGFLSANANAVPDDLILMGSYLEHVTKTDPHSLDRLMKGLDEFLERDRDRELFDLPSNQGKP